jgi:hypothetical protein
MRNKLWGRAPKCKTIILLILYRIKLIKRMYTDKFIPAMYNRFVYASLLRLILEGYFEVCISSIPVLTFVRY